MVGHLFGLCGRKPYSRKESRSMACDAIGKKGGRECKVPSAQVQLMERRGEERRDLFMYTHTHTHTHMYI